MQYNDEGSVNLERDSEERAETRLYQRKIGYQGAQTSYPEPAWNKRHLVFLYEDIGYNQSGVDFSRIQELEIGKTTVVSSKVVLTYCWDKLPITEFVVPKQPVFDTRTYFWITKNKKNINSTEAREKLSEYFSSCNPHFPYLLGLQHHNRFKRGTKVYILEGPFSGRHGSVVGHLRDFDILDEKSPVLKVLTVDSSNRLEIVNVLQHIVKIIDLHNRIDFAIPTSNSYSFPTRPSNFK